MASPGRWRIEDRRLPHDDVATELRDMIWKGLKEMEGRLPGGSMRATLLKTMAGGLKESPLPAGDVD